MMRIKYRYKEQGKQVKNLRCEEWMCQSSEYEIDLIMKCDVWLKRVTVKQEDSGILCELAHG